MFIFYKIFVLFFYNKVNLGVLFGVFCFEGGLFFFFIIMDLFFCDCFFLFFLLSCVKRLFRFLFFYVRGFLYSIFFLGVFLFLELFFLFVLFLEIECFEDM